MDQTSDDWKTFRIGERVRLSEFPREFREKGLLLPETRKAYQYMVKRRHPFTIWMIDEYDFPWVQFQFRGRNGRMEYHTMALNHSGVVRVCPRVRRAADWLVILCEVTSDGNSYTEMLCKVTPTRQAAEREVRRGWTAPFSWYRVERRKWGAASGGQHETYFYSHQGRLIKKAPRRYAQTQLREFLKCRSKEAQELFGDL